MKSKVCFLSFVIISEMAECLDYQQALIECENENYDYVEKYLTSNDYLTSKEYLNNGDDMSLLSFVVANDETEFVRILLNKKEVVEIIDLTIDGIYFTPLMYGCTFSMKHSVSLLLKKGADTECKNNFGETALFLAIKNDFIEGIYELLHYGANVNHQDDSGETALMNVIQMSEYRLSLAKLFIRRGANPYLQNNKGKVFMDFIKRCHKQKMQKYIEDFYVCNIKPSRK